MPGFGYINARVRAMKSRLATARLDEAVNATSYAEFLRILSETALSEDLGEATAPGAGLEELDRSVSRNFFNTAQKLARLADGPAGEDIAILLARYDVQNVKAIARGKLTGRPAAEIEASLFAAGNYRPADLTRLAREPDLATFMAGLAVTPNPLSGLFRRALAGLAADGDLLAFETALDRGYFDWALKTAHERALKDHLRREVDAANILTAVKVQAQGGPAEPEAYFLPGGVEFTRGRFLEAAEGTGGLEGLSAFRDLSDLGDGTAPPSLADVEAGVRFAMNREARNLYLSDPIGIGVVIGFLREKERESALVRLIGRGKVYNVPVETLQREVNRGA
ncbi:MAG TPA: V-type ATPase subunit [Deinococcales bacterium]|nr:V-type ATPase subunit [Deinococcales bacterium]